MITVFTPTYNRAYSLPKLYHSLCSQSSLDFEWLIVDDGSVDNTKQLVEMWIDEKKIKIRYFFQKNAGKPAAHNKGVKEAEGELFTCVDSDDYLKDNAVEETIKTWGKIKNKGLVGILSFRVHSDNTPITKIKSDVKKATLHDAYKKYGLSGDTMLVFKTDIIKQFEFPIIEGEKFIPEGYIYNKIDKLGKLFILRKGLYVCEYLEDGYTHNVSKLIFNNYKGYILHINERMKNCDNEIDKIKDSIRYDSVMIAHNEKGIIKKALYPLYAIIGFVPAYIIAHRRYGKFIKE